MTGPTPKGFDPAPTITVLAPTPLNLGIQVQPSFDVIELLPPAAADKLRALRQRSADAHVVIPHFEDIQQASMARIDAENALRRLTNHPHDRGFHLPETDSRVVSATKHLEKMTASLERLKASSEVKTAAWQSSAQAPAACEDWLKNGRPGNTVLEDVEVEPPKLLKNETVIDAIERHRRRVRELRADQHRIRSAPFPSSLAKSQMREQIDALAQRGAPSVSLLIEHDREIVWPTTRVKVDVLNAGPGAIGFIEIPDTLAIDAWRNKDALIAALDREIAAESDDAAALSHEARKKAEAEVLDALLDIEMQEASLVWRAMDEKLPVDHRADCSPLAILGVVLVTQSVNPSPETTPGYSYSVSGQASAQRQRVAARKVDKPPPPLG